MQKNHRVSPVVVAAGVWRKLLRAGLATMVLTAGANALASPAVVATAKPLEIWFIRHAESEVNVISQPLAEPDEGVSYPLTAKGMMQASELASTFKDVPVTAIYSSTRLRTLQTADAIAFTKGLALRLAPEIVEIGVGMPSPPATESEWEEVKVLMQRWAAGDEEIRFGDENLGDVRRRFTPFWQRLLASHGGDKGVVVVVTHGGIMSFVIPALCKNIPLEIPMKHHISNAGIVKTELNGETLRCKSWDGNALI